MVAKIRIYARPQSIKQARRPEFYKYIDRYRFNVFLDVLVNDNQENFFLILFRV